MMAERPTFSATPSRAASRFAALPREERFGLAIAVGLHVLLLLVLVFQPAPDELLERPERMTVSLASDIGLEETAPVIVPESRAAIAPNLSDDPQPSVENTPPQAEQAIAAPNTSTAPPRDTPRPQPTAKPEPRQGGGSQIGDSFLDGAGNSRTSDDARLPASQIGASAKASIIQAIVRQIRPHWTAPSGVDSELLVTELAFDLDENGRLRGRPRVLRQGGINASNRPQASLHAERAVRAVQLAAPFDLPDEYYNAWKSIRGARFDRNLSR
ncbi:MAG: energy transducer TonB [Erythrobacter sp.]